MMEGEWQIDFTMKSWKVYFWFIQEQRSLTRNAIDTQDTEIWRKWFSGEEDLTLHKDVVHPMSLEELCFCCVSLSAVSEFLWALGLEPTRLLCPWSSPGKSTGVGFWRYPSPGDRLDPGIESRPPASQTDSLDSGSPFRSRELSTCISHNKIKWKVLQDSEVKICSWLLKSKSKQLHPLWAQP